MMFAIPIVTSPLPVESGGSLVYALVAVAAVIVVMAVLWWARLWGRSEAPAGELRGVTPIDVKKAA